MPFRDFLAKMLPFVPKGRPASEPLAVGETPKRNSEEGSRLTFDELFRLQTRLWINFELLQVIQDIRRMDRVDGRVKKIHSRSARTAAKGGLRLVATAQPRLEREWRRFKLATKINNPQKLHSDIRGLMTDGHLAIQWVLDGNGQVCAAPRMPPESLRPITNDAGVFPDPVRAYEQVDLTSGNVLATFGLWQLTMGRLDPVNFDDWGCAGRPYLDASRAVWKKLDLTEEDLVIRRHMRAPLRMSHVLEGASKEDLLEYRDIVERDQASGNVKDYYSSKKGSVTPVQGDANLDHIADVAHLLDTFASGTPMPKGLFGYIGDLSRDILEDLKKDWYEELHALQMVAASVYEQGFRLHLLLNRINPDAYDFSVAFEERLTDSPNQRADLALKIRALGASRETSFETAGLNAPAELRALERESREHDPYPEDVDEPDANGDPIVPRQSRDRPRVSVTPGNAPKGESATSISNQ